MLHLRQHRQLLVGITLAVVMAATRFNHFGSPVALPDASLAVFWLGGLYLRPLCFPLFLVEAGLMDWASIAGGVSGWCVTPAYGFLIPTYACLWLAGSWYTRHARFAWQTLLPLVSSLGLSLILAFAISNGSFYLFSRYFDGLGWSDYAHAVIGYLPGYVGYALLYVAAALAVHAAVLALPRRPQPAGNG